MAGRANDQRVDAAGPDRLDHLLQLAQLCPHFGQVGAVVPVAFPGHAVTRLSQGLRRLSQRPARSSGPAPRPFKLQSDQQTVAVGEVADELADRRREPSDHSGRGQDLVSGGSARVLEHVHDLDRVAACQVLLAGAAQILDRPLAPGRGVGHVQAQIPLLVTVGASPVIRGARLAHRVSPLWGEASAQRRAAIVDRSDSVSATWWPSRRSIRLISVRSASSWSWVATRWASRSMTLRCSSRRRWASSSAIRSSSSRSAACWVTRAEPASTPAAPIYTSTSSTP